MKSAFALLGLVAAGCAGAPSKPTVAKAPPPPVPAPPDVIREADFTIAETGTPVRIGDTWADAEKVFPPPRGSFPVEELPAGFSSPYEAKGWEGPREGFGVILYDGKIRLAVWQRDRVTAEQVERTFEFFRRSTGEVIPTDVPSKRAHALFWQDKGQRLMIVHQRLKAGDRLTVALGQDLLMDRIGASLAKAQNNARQLDALSDKPAVPEKKG